MIIRQELKHTTHPMWQTISATAATYFIKTNSPIIAISTSSTITTTTTLQQHQYEQILQLDNRSYQPAQNISEAPLLQFSAFAFNESPIQLGLENLDIDNFDHDMLWKDVDSVMNDFGFHTMVCVVDRKKRSGFFLVQICT